MTKNKVFLNQVSQQNNNHHEFTYIKDIVVLISTAFYKLPFWHWNGPCAVKRYKNQKLKICDHEISMNTDVADY